MADNISFSAVSIASRPVRAIPDGLNKISHVVGEHPEKHRPSGLGILGYICFG